jgi:homoserine O-succinyltransferase/O-acetyltransferase
MSSAAHNAARCGDGPLVIGFVNNMPDAALETTERQFQELLASAAGDHPIRIRLFALPELPRSDDLRAYVARHYEAPGELWSSRLDGLIVTGTEPRAPRLQDEPYWPTLTRLIDWAEDHTISTVWSCLAAHAAVLHTDAITRRPFATKLSGVFECERAASHPLVAGAPSRWSVPHSRYNDLPIESLVAAGYRIVASSPEVGADLFVKEGKSLSIYLQGHPEYDADALFREYRRDVRRFLAGEREHYPEMPFGYFDDEARAAFAAFRDRATANRSPDLLHDIPTVAAERLAFTWREPAVRLYANWLSCLARRKYPRHGEKNGMIPR